MCLPISNFVSFHSFWFIPKHFIGFLLIWMEYRILFSFLGACYQKIKKTISFSILLWYIGILLISLISSISIWLYLLCFLGTLREERRHLNNAKETACRNVQLNWLKTIPNCSILLLLICQFIVIVSLWTRYVFFPHEVRLFSVCHNTCPNIFTLDT